MIPFQHRFGSHLGPPKRSQDAPKSMLKWHQNLISFGRPLGTRLFRPKRRQDAPAPQIAAEDGVGPGLLGDDLGGGSPDLHAPRTFESRNGSKKISGSSKKTWWPRLARRPQLGGGLKPPWWAVTCWGLGHKGGPPWATQGPGSHGPMHPQRPMDPPTLVLILLTRAAQTHFFALMQVLLKSLNTQFL